MIKTSIVIALVMSSVNLALAGAKPAAFNSLSVSAAEIKVPGEIKVPVPSVPVTEIKSPEYRTIRVCSYMFAYGQSGDSGVGVFAFDIGSEGRICEIPVSHGQANGSYPCKDNNAVTAPTTAGDMALLFRDLRADGSSLYHQLNVPPDFAGQNKFRGRMRISGKPPMELSKPLERNGAGVYQLSCKMQSVAFSPN